MYQCGKNRENKCQRKSHATNIKIIPTRNSYMANEQKKNMFTLILKCSKTFQIKILSIGSDPDDCAAANDPCQNGATCIDGAGEYWCNCLDDFTGEHCETGIVHCDITGFLLSNWLLTTTLQV